MNDLGIDLENFKFDFARDWNFFRQGKVKRFLVMHLQHQIELWRTKLERAATLEDVKEAQGEIGAHRHTLALLENAQVMSQVNEVLKRQ